MSFFGNIIWIVFGGLIHSIAWLFFGALWCLTIVGIPIGVQCFKMASLQFAPFGKEVVTVDNGGVAFLANILWIIFGGIELALGNLISGVILCLTIVGIPFGLQFFKLAQLSLMPFGKEIR
ncbi:YccF domain-containing protein [Clostridium sp. 'White wine YQ']|uniref:YccF domain-containing protein n=1 Tax=Clostridium sp. 'White wine YQ' TaxID=3027474 RepID=UPI0023670899|nr:YccF domain-containing protein [Clostridium sp. 'White wine YQ']MDD7794946.1 YccF domain-containing protein [Clostridium sp. 'White wine YQ']